jgi:ketosteroid isomerase-like protein
MKKLFPLACLAIILFACGSPKTDTANVKATLMEIDRDFSKLSVDKGMIYAFSTYSAEDVVRFRDGDFPNVGKQSLLKTFEGKSDTSIRLTWEPVFADIAESGELGYTHGTWKMYVIPADTTYYGVYVTIWKKQVDGTWKFVFDGGNDTPAPEGSQH